MELKRKLNPKYLFVALYFVCFAVYLVIGLGSVEATNYNITGKVVMPSIGLVSDVAKLSLNDGKINTPDEIVGSYQQANNKTLLVGHSSTVFDELDDISVGDVIIYNGEVFKITSKVVMDKADISMNELLKSAKRDTLAIMTCAGEDLGNGDFSQRLIVTAILE